MKRTVLLIYALTVLTTLTLGDDIIEKLANAFEMTRTQVQTCFNKTNIVPEDLMRIDELIDNDEHTGIVDKAALKVGCFLACIAQKKGIMAGPHISTEKIIELTDTKIKGNPFLIYLRKKVLDICVDRVQGKIDECEVSLEFLLCTMHQIRRSTP